MSGIRTGFNQRTKPVMQVLKGFDPQSPLFKQVLLPVQANVTVLSGQVVRAYKNNTTKVYEFALADGSGVGVPCLALNSTQNADVALTQLTGLPIDGDFEVQTAFFTAGTYTVGTKLTYDTVNKGNVKPATFVDGKTTDPVIGEVTGLIDGPLDLGQKLNETGTKRYSNGDTNAAVAPVSVIQFRTYLGANN